MLQPHRAVAPAPDVDLPVVAGHAVAATRRRLVTDLALTVVLLVALLSATAKAVAVVFGLVAAVATWRTLQDLRRRDTGAALFHGLIAAAAWALCLVPVLVRSVEQSYGRRDPYLQSPLTGPQFLLVLAGALWLVLFLSRMATLRALTGAATGTRERGQTGFVAARFDYLARAATGNVTVYSPAAPAGPFVGLGNPVGAWTLTVPLKPVARIDLDDGLVVAQAGALDVTALYAGVRARWEELAAGPATGRPMGGLVVEERLFVSGRLPPRHPLLEDGLPVPEVPSGILRDVAARARGVERTYLAARAVRPDGGAVLTCFLYLGLAAGVLFVEFVQTSLSPVRSDFRAAAVTEEGGGLGPVLSAAGKALLDVVRVAPVAPVETARRLWALVGDVTHRPLGDRAQRAAGQLDYGARRGVRELAAEPGHRVVDELDLNEYARVMERCLVDALTSTLSEHGFDPSGLTASEGGPSPRHVVSLPVSRVDEPLRPLG